MVWFSDSFGNSMLVFKVFITLWMFCQNTMLLHWSQFVVSSFPKPTLPIHLCSLQGRVANPPSQRKWVVGSWPCLLPCHFIPMASVAGLPVAVCDFQSLYLAPQDSPRWAFLSHWEAAVHPDGPLLGCCIPSEPLLWAQKTREGCPLCSFASVL